MKKYMMRKASMNMINWLNCIWETNLPSNSKYLACYLRKFMNDNQDIAWPSYSRIIDETGLARSTVAKYLQILEDEGWIQRDRGSKGANTVYIASLPKSITETVKEIDDKLQLQLKGSSRDELGSTPDEPPLVRQTNSNKQVNKQSNKQNTDISLKRNVYFIDELSVDDFYHCQEAMRVLKDLKKSGFAVYDGSLSKEEWIDCENAMRSCDEFDHVGYFEWWLEKHGNSFTKKPALTNMLCDMNGIEFDRFYDMTYLQEAD